MDDTQMDATGIILWTWLAYTHSIPICYMAEKGFIKEGKMQPWKKDLQQLAKRENVYCKLSGMVLRASWDNWRQQDFSPYMEAVLEMFGPERLMFGSDWPVCTAVVSYGQFLGIVSGFVNTLSPTEQAKIMGLNAAKFYDLEI